MYGISFHKRDEVYMPLHISQTARNYDLFSQRSGDRLVCSKTADDDDDASMRACEARQEHQK